MEEYCEFACSSQTLRDIDGMMEQHDNVAILTLRTTVNANVNVASCSGIVVCGWAEAQNAHQYETLRFIQFFFINYKILLLLCFTNELIKIIIDCNNHTLCFLSLCVSHLYIYFCTYFFRLLLCLLLLLVHWWKAWKSDASPVFNYFHNWKYILFLIYFIDRLMLFARYSLQ